MSNAAAASTVIQDAHIVHSPRRSHIAPSTAADTAVYVSELDDDDSAPSLSRRSSLSISSSLLDYSPSTTEHRRPRPHHGLPPLPDLRFEQSYLASVAPAKGVWWKVALLTLKDQALMPLMQGMALNLIVFGWRRWNRAIRFRGDGIGARVRRWWWEINNWDLPMEGEK